MTGELVSKSPVGGAGILPYSIDSKGNVFVYFSRDAKGGWADFGGNFEPGDEQRFKTEKKAAYQIGAAREFSEESMQSFKGLNNQTLDETTMLSLLQSAPNDQIKLVDVALPRSTSYGLFLVPVKYEEKTLFNRFNQQREKYLVPLNEFIKNNPAYEPVKTDYKKAVKSLKKRPDFPAYWDLKTKAEKDVLVTVNINDLLAAIKSNNPQVKVASSSNEELIKSGSVIKLRANFIPILKKGLDQLEILAQATQS